MAGASCALMLMLLHSVVSALALFQPKAKTTTKHTEANDVQIWQSKEKASLKNSSFDDSEGFFNEPDWLWEERKGRQINQMEMQNQMMTACPDDVFQKQQVCMNECRQKFNNHETCPPSVFWQVHYEPSFSCVEERRVGNGGEGGKWICDPEKITEKTNPSCLVYSIGSNGQFDFEESVHDTISNNCEIHTIDMNPWEYYKRSRPPNYVNYHVYKVGPEPASPVPSIIDDLGHQGREIDIFKIDCEGCEWETYKSWFGEGVYIRQIQVELHGWVDAYPTRGSPDTAHEFFNFLFDLGYVIFHKEPNIIGSSGGTIEYAFVKMSPSFARAK